MLRHFTHQPNKNLLKAAKENNITELQACINQNANINTMDELDNTALHWASLEGYEAVVSLLIEHKAKVNEVNGECKTPLTLSVERNDLNIAQYLLLHNASPNIFGPTYRAYTKLFQITLDVVFISTLLMMHFSPQYSKLETVFLFASFLILIVARDVLHHYLNFIERSIPPLIIAAQRNQLDMVKLLIQYKASINAIDPTTGQNALHWGVRYNNMDAVEFLVRHGIDINLRDKNGHTSLDIARKIKNKDIIEYLETGLIPNEKYEISKSSYDSLIGLDIC
jgi:serine/threonine-protein phosphatase 6 regulatory ankyrin repeat subunit B